MKKKKPQIKLPQIKHRKSGLKKSGKKWVVLYYEDDKLKSWNTHETNLTRAISRRDEFHTHQIKHGATYMGGTLAVVEAAKADPEGMAGIYESVTYKVTIGGVNVICTTDKQKAIDSRNEYINQHHAN
jgi:hypothetical protein